jgi:hypothetical protein
MIEGLAPISARGLFAIVTLTSLALRNVRARHILSDLPQVG